MVSINPNFGPQGLGRADKAQTTSELPKPETIVDEITIAIRNSDGSIDYYDDRCVGGVIFIDRDKDFYYGGETEGSYFELRGGKVTHDGGWTHGEM